MNRLAVGLAVGAGYVLGRTKKAKFAFAVGTMVAGKRLNLSPKALGSLVTQQLENNPQFKEIGDQLRQDLRGVGKAATGSLLNRQLEGLADRLHDRTLDVQDRIAGVVPEDAKNLKGKVVGRHEHEDEDDEGQEEEQPQDRKQDREREKAPAKRSSGSRSSGSRSGQKADSKSTSAPSAATKKAPAKKTAQKATARKTTQKKSTAARDTARRATSARSGGTSKGGRDNG
jgi:hypothetical protein